MAMCKIVMFFPGVRSAPVFDSNKQDFVGKYILHSTFHFYSASHCYFSLISKEHLTIHRVLTNSQVKKLNTHTDCQQTIFDGLATKLQQKK